MPSVRGERPPPARRARTLPERRAELERDAIRGALAATGGNRVAAAQLLRISRATLYEKLARYPELARECLIRAPSAPTDIPDIRMSVYPDTAQARHSRRRADVS